MGILDKVNNSEEQSSDSREEVTINPVQEESREEEKEESRLKKEAERELTGSSEVSLEDVHRQNERIIELLEKMVGEKNDIGSGDSISDRRNNRNSTKEDDEGMRGGMDELL